MSAASQFMSTKAGKYTAVAAVGLVVVVLAYTFFKAEIGKVAKAAKDAATGKTNLLGTDLTSDADYGGAGVVGSLGSTVNELSGDNLDDAGTDFGTWLYDMTHPDQGPTNRTPSN